MINPIHSKDRLFQHLNLPCGIEFVQSKVCGHFNDRLGVRRRLRQPDAHKISFGNDFSVISLNMIKAAKSATLDLLKQRRG